MALLLDEQVCLEKTIPNLLLFILWPDQSRYLSRHFVKIFASFLVVFEKRTILSAYITCVTAGPLALALAPLMFLEQSSLSNILERTSFLRMNRYEERGSPCLKPLLGLNCSDLPPLTKTLRWDASWNPTYKPIVKSEISKHSLDEAPINSIISLLEVQFNSHEACFNFSDLKAVEKFMNNNLIFYDPSSRNKCRLARRDELMEHKS